MSHDNANSVISAAGVPAPLAVASIPPSVAEGDLSATHDEQWVTSSGRDDGRFLFAVVAALSLHLLPILIATGGWGIGNPGKIGSGDPAGSKDGVNVELIDATEYERRFVSFTSGKDAADSESKPATPAQSPVSPETKSEAAPEQPPEPSPTPQPTKLSEADIAKILESAKLDFESATEATSKASIANQGQSSEFVRGVLRKLKQTMPRSNGLKGTVVIGIVLSEAGKIEWVGVLKSSNRRELDQLVVERVRATQFEAPRTNVSLQERKFQITYQYN